MDINLLTLSALFGSGILAGLLGALVGVGGGIIVVPTLVLGFGVDIRIAVAASLVAVVASSTAAGSVYVGKGLANMRLGMMLEIATTIGGISGGVIASILPSKIIAILFAAIMFLTSFLMLKKKENDSRPANVNTPQKESQLTQAEEQNEIIGSLDGSYFDPYLNKTIDYKVQKIGFGSSISFLAGILSGMLGVGGGFLKVPAMTLGMKIPMKVAAGTSNFMIGVTAISSLFVYFSRGLVYPMIAAPIAIGVTGGALFGTSIAPKTSPNVLRKIFSFVAIFVGLQMILKALEVSIGK